MLWRFLWMTSLEEEPDNLPTPILYDGRLATDHKLAFIDAVRGIAILMVIWVHHSQKFHEALPLVTKLASFGQMGVQLFFIASAYTLYRSYTLRHGERSAVRNFYIRRYFRIAPLYYLGIIIYAAIAFAKQGGNAALNYSFFNILSNVTFLHGLVPSANNTIVPGGWSIATEMMFYLVFPLLFHLYAKRPGTSGRNFAYAAVGTAFALNLIVQASIIAIFGKGISNNNFLYFSVLNQMPVFLVGFLLYFDHSKLRPCWRPVLGFLAFVAATGAAFRWFGWLGATAGPLVAATSFFFLFLILREGVFPLDWLEKLGQVSYSMYIFHFIFAWEITGGLVKLFPTGSSTALFLYAGTLVASIGATYWIARLSKWTLEDRFIEIGRKLIRRLNASERNVLRA